MRGSEPAERRGGRQRGAKNKLTVARERAEPYVDPAFEARGWNPYLA
jgi:hypothetical protein